MKTHRRVLLWILCMSLFAAGGPFSLAAQEITPSMYQSMRWRMIGPFRAGRTVGAEGVPSKPNVFYIGVNNGGVWKTDDYGRTWIPIFDDQPTGSIGCLAIAPSNPDIIYVGSGEGLQRPDLSTGDGEEWLPLRLNMLATSMRDLVVKDDDCKRQGLLHTLR